MGLPKEIIAIHGVPRSGTSWLGQIFNSSPRVAFRYQPLFSYAFRGRLSETSNSKEINDFYLDLYNTRDPFVLQKDPVIHHEYPKFKKYKQPDFLILKHVRYHYLLENLLENSSIKLVSIVRHPCAVLNSWLNAPKEFDSSWNIKQEWRTAPQKNRGMKGEYFGYERWKESTQLFVKLSRLFPDRTYILKYGDLIKNPEKSTSKLFHFCKIPMEKQTREFLSTSTSINSNHPYGVFKIRVDDTAWKNELPQYIQEFILKDLQQLDFTI